MKLRGRLLFISLFAVGVPVVAMFAVALGLILENGNRSQEKYFVSVVEGIQKEVDDSAALYRQKIRVLSEQEYFRTKLYFYNKYWHYIDPETLRSDIQLLKTELESFLLTERIDTISVYRTDYSRYVQVLTLGNGTYVPDVMYRETVLKYPNGVFYQHIAGGVYVNFFLPVVLDGKEIGLLLFQRGYNQPYFEALSLRYGTGLALFMQGLFRFDSLPGIEQAWRANEISIGKHLPFGGTYIFENRPYAYSAHFFEIGDGVNGYIVVGGPSAVDLGDWWWIFLRLAAVLLGCVVLSAAVFYFWGNTLIRFIRELRTAAGQVGTGHFAIALPERRSDEFGELFRGFNRMAADLRENALRLEDNKRKLIESERMAALGEFAAGVAHEINNPLGIVLNNVQLVRTGKLSGQDEARVLGTMESELKRIAKLLGNLLGQVRQGEYAKKPLRLKSLTEEMVGLFEPKFKSRNVAVEVGDFPETLEIDGDTDALKQVFFNVINNALQAIHHRHGRIRISARNADGRCAVEFEDNGIGMNETVLARIFEPFYSQRNGKGTGLGLAVSERIMKGHEGSISVASAPERGTSVTLVFPRRSGDESE